MKKILFVHHAGDWGGAPKNMINIINSLDKQIYQAKVLLLKDSDVLKDKLKNNNIEFDVVNNLFYKRFYKYYSHTDTGLVKWYLVIFQLRRILSWILSYFIFANTELKRFDYDLVHLNSSVLSDWIEPAKKRGKVIIHIQESLSKGQFGLRHSFFRKIIKKADQIIAISHNSAERIGIPEKTEIIYNFSNVINNFVADKESYKSKKVLYLGGASIIKGFLTLVKALDYIDDDIKIYFGGYYPKDNKVSIKDIIKRIYKSSKLMDAVITMRNNKSAIEIGLVENVNEYIDECVCLVSPFSSPHFSRPIIESFGRKKPVITTDFDGVEDMVVNSDDGIIVKKDNYIELSKAINYIARNPIISIDMGEKAYIKAQNKFSERNISLFQIIYNNLLK